MREGATRKQFLKKAEKRNITVHKNNINRAKPLERICGSIKARHSSSTEELLDR